MAAISTLATLKTAVINWLKRPDLTSYLDELIQMGESYSMRHVRAPEMEEAFSGTISSGTLAVPSSYLSLKWAKVNGSSNAYLEMRPTQWIMQQYPIRSAAGSPRFIGRDGSVFQFGPYPSEGYSITGYYYKKPPSVLGTEHSVFTGNPDLYLFATLCEAEPFMKNDPRIQVWQAKRDRIVADINGDAREGRYGDGMEIKVA